ncbi:enoyl-CoA hydratase/isomerase family protein [Variovorax ginsengisoli]|uniref:Enoyl-CoA hydratase-related protein n=1 Tax=Variovorax ginsengisoli TaxID=363844 RepID=A0ABT8S8H8_9BURK|nr:enoyl-CoA hydratase-related protein [Variovorax ginsengisoli]MDN8615152.1 enoyl-CoA hydratase-related protein [Variovorax ginsengisoli]MDO1534322.1 enoyl-CoA hydratase-related protein [Variovorax ginsengisoli]
MISRVDFQSVNQPSCSMTSTTTAALSQPPALSIEGALATITFRRPANHNRIEPDDVAILRGYLKELNANHDVRVIVFRGEGKTFSSGFDLTRLGKVAGQSTENSFEVLTDEVENARAITIARLDGPVYGGSTDLALACDFRIGAEGIRMFMPAARLGLHYYGHGLRRWVSRLGIGPAKKLFLTSRQIDANEMRAIGYLDAVVPAALFEAEMQRWIDELLAMAPVPLVSIKTVLNDIARQQYDEEAAKAAYHASLKTEDIGEALAAFAEKRKPVFKGR